MTTYNLLELITVYVKKLLEKDKKKKTQLDSPFYNNNNTKKMSIKISICIKKCVFCWNKVMIDCVNWFDFKVLIANSQGSRKLRWLQKESSDL